MKTTTLLNKITLSVALLLMNSTIILAANKEPLISIASQNDKTEALNLKQHSPKTDSYLMVMQQQVEKGDQSITYSFYIDQLKDIYKINQLNADIEINFQMTETVNMK